MPRSVTNMCSTASLLDGIAMSASVVCMMHCLALPVLLALLPAFAGLVGSSGETFHVLMLLLAIPTSGVALISGWRKYHARRPLMLGASGLTLMALGICFTGQEAVETGMTVTGSLMLAGAHILNWLKRRNGHHHRPSQVASQIPAINRQD